MQLLVDWLAGWLAGYAGWLSILFLDSSQIRFLKIKASALLLGVGFEEKALTYDEHCISLLEGICFFGFLLSMGCNGRAFALLLLLLLLFCGD